MNEDAYIERTEAFPPTSGCEPDDTESMEVDNQRAEEQTAQQRFDESVQREIRRLIAKGKAESMEPLPWTDPKTQPKAFHELKQILLESMEWPTQPCESMEFRDGLPPISAVPVLAEPNRKAGGEARESTSLPLEKDSRGGGNYCCENCSEIDRRINGGA